MYNKNWMYYTMIILASAGLYVGYNFISVVERFDFIFIEMMGVLLFGILIAIAIMNLENKWLKAIRYLYIGYFVIYLIEILTVPKGFALALRPYHYVTILGIISIIVGRFLPASDFEIGPKIKVISIALMIIAFILAFWQTEIEFFNRVFINYIPLVLLTISEYDFVPVEEPRTTSYSLNNNTEKV